MSEEAKTLTSEEVSALRRCAAACWQNRGKLGLSASDREAVLVGWMAIGSATEGAAAAEALAALRQWEDRQLRFDRLLDGGSEKHDASHQPV